MRKTQSPTQCPVPKLVAFEDDAVVVVAAEGVVGEDWGLRRLSLSAVVVVVVVVVVVGLPRSKIEKEMSPEKLAEKKKKTLRKRTWSSVEREDVNHV